MNNHICENPKCGKVHDGSFGSGRFCSEHCRRVYAGIKSAATAIARGTHKTNFNSVTHKIKRQWKCDVCGGILFSRRELILHKKENHPLHTCKFCGKSFDKCTQLGAHSVHCKLDPKYQERLKHIVEVASKSFKGKHHTEATKAKLRRSTAEYLQNNWSGRVRFSYRGCDYINQLNEKCGYNFQHALNGGEVVIDGFFLDGYDRNNNIAFEYDERRHYKDVINNVLIDKDIDRMRIIHEKTNCRFIRYNETIKCLYEVVSNGNEIFNRDLNAES